ncbi:MAG: glutamate-5-semialdehyde dehydrogenase, partial [bacterium]
VGEGANRVTTVITANQKDLDHASSVGQPQAFIDRLALNEKRIDGLIESLETIINLPDPVGEEFDHSTLKNGIKLYKLRVPIGVILIVYEARPNVTIDTFALCLKSGNSCLLKGGTLSRNTNLALVEIITQALQDNHVPEGFCQYLDLPQREQLPALLKEKDYIDLVIPRGGEALVKTVTENALMPVIKHDKGIVHIFVDKEADLQKSWDVCLNAKINRPSTCNSLDVILVHNDIANDFIPTMVQKYKEIPVEIRGCERTQKIAPQITAATAKDWDTEFLDYIVGIKIVADLAEATDFMNTHGSRHSEGIMTENETTTKQFIATVDAAVLFTNASTRLNDGGIFGLGAELGISTEKIHARGPMGLREMTIYKWIALGTGQIRE